MFFSTFENENLELYKNGGRSAMLQTFPRGSSAMKGGISAMLQTFPLGGRFAMLQIFRRKVCNIADLPGGGLQGGRSAIQHRRLSVCLSGSHAFLVVTHTCSYVSQATHAFIGMLPLCLANLLLIEKGRDLTQSYGKNSHRKLQIAK